MKKMISILCLLIFSTVTGSAFAKEVKELESNINSIWTFVEKPYVDRAQDRTCKFVKGILLTVNHKSLKKEAKRKAVMIDLGRAILQLNEFSNESLAAEATLMPIKALMEEAFVSVSKDKDLEPVASLAEFTKTTINCK